MSSVSPVRTGASTPPARLGTLEVRLARTAAEVRSAQELRFSVFRPQIDEAENGGQNLAQYDADRFDADCDHLLVIDHAEPQSKVVATSRLMPRHTAEQGDGFYSATEFEISALLARHATANFLELGRCCVLRQYRNTRAVELLWRGTWAHVLRNHFNVMIGCASFEGTDPNRLALSLSYLHHFARAPEPWRAAALPQCYVELNRVPKSAIDARRAFALLPPLIKGYLRLGAYVGDGAVIDHEFDTIDVLIVLPVDAIKCRYINHFGNANRRATELLPGDGA